MLTKQKRSFFFFFLRKEKESCREGQVVQNVMHKTCGELREEQAEREGGARWESDQRGVSGLGNLEQLCTTDVSSWTWRMGYNTQEQKNSGTDNTRKKQYFATFFVWFLGLFLDFYTFLLFLSA